MYIKRLKSFIVLSVLLSSISVFGIDFSKLPIQVQNAVHKYYNNKSIKLLSAKRKDKIYTLVIQTESGKDQVTVNKKGKILSISDYLGDMQPTGGC